MDSVFRLLKLQNGTARSKHPNGETLAGFAVRGYSAGLGRWKLTAYYPSGYGSGVRGPPRAGANGTCGAGDMVSLGLAAVVLPRTGKHARVDGSALVVSCYCCH